MTLPAIPSIDGEITPQLRAILSAMKENIEVRSGQRKATDDDKFATAAEVAAARAAAAAATSAVQAFPVNSIFISVVATNPATLLGYGTWAAFGAGRVLVGLDAGQIEFDTVEETGGAKTHTLVTTEIPAHVHQQTLATTADPSTVLGSNYSLDNSGAGTSVGNASGNTSGGLMNTQAAQNTLSSGGGGAHNNLQPYIVVHMWKRTA